MKISQLIEIMSVTGRTIPSDIFDQIETEYVSDSKGEVIKIKDMDLIHLTRILKPLVMGFNSSTQTHLFMKRIVINVTADLVTRNDKGEYGLRFPRFLSIREDKPVSEINTINDVTLWYSG